MTIEDVIIRQLGLEDYVNLWHSMQAFTNMRHAKTRDEIWLVEHPPVFTQGQNGKAEHILSTSTIPVINVDRGGQVTYHGPGQLMAYTMVDLKRKKFYVRQMVNMLENSVIALLKDYQIASVARCEAPGVYINHKKICSVGLRIRRGASFHGLALNVDMNLTPFKQINPCGYQDLQMTQLADHVQCVNMTEVRQKLVGYLVQQLGYNNELHLVDRWNGTENSE